jgi:hypothetical protein
MLIINNKQWSFIMLLSVKAKRHHSPQHVSMVMMMSCDKRMRMEKHRCTTHVGTIGRVSCDSCWQDININKVTKMDGRHWTSSGIEVSRNSKNFLNKKVGFTKIITDKFDNITPFRCCCVFLNILCIFLISLFVAITSPIRKCI